MQEREKFHRWITAMYTSDNSINFEVLDGSDNDRGFMFAVKTIHLTKMCISFDA